MATPSEFLTLNPFNVMEELNVLLRFEHKERQPLLLPSVLFNMKAINDLCDMFFDNLGYHRAEVWSFHDFTLWFIRELKDEKPSNGQG